MIDFLCTKRKYTKVKNNHLKMARCANFAYLLLLVFPYTHVTAISLNSGQYSTLNEDVNSKCSSNSEQSIDELIYLSKTSVLLKNDIENLKNETVDKMAEQAPGLVELSRKLSIIFENSLKISKNFDKFLEYHTKPEKYNNEINNIIVSLFANNIVSKKSAGTSHLLEEIYKNLILEDTASTSVLNLIADHINIFRQNCRSSEQILNELLRSIIYTEMKGFLTIRYAYRVLESHNNESYNHYIKKAEYDGNIRLNSTINAFQNVINKVSTKIKNNDLPQHIEATISTTTGIITLANQLWSDIETSTKIVNNENICTPEKDLMAHLKYLATVDNLKANILNILDETVKITDTNAIPELIKLNRRLALIFSNSLIIGESYDNILQYIEKPEKFNPKILKEFALKVTSKNAYGLHYLLEDIYTLLTISNTTDPSTIDLLIKNMEFLLQSRNILKTPQQLLNNILTSTIYAEIKGYLTMRYSYQLLSLYEGGHYERDIELIKYNFSHRINETITTFEKIMSIASREMWKDDPQQYIDGVTFTELKHVFQRYVANEYDISTDDNCDYTCSAYDAQRKATNNCYYKDICAHQRVCEGYLYGCTSTSNYMNICPSDKSSSRRYQYIEDIIDGHRYGSKEQCSTFPIYVDTHILLLRKRRCDPCMCVCADTTAKSERYFNLDLSIARFEDNYVITGVRLVKQNHIVHIQIQEGQLLPDGNINQSTVAWAPINDKPKSVHTLIYDKSRGINLDDLQAPENHVLIGLSFSSESFQGSDNVFYKRLHLKALSTPLNFTSGTLFTDSSYHRELISKSSADEVVFNDLDIPTRNTIKGSGIKSKPNQFLKFATTGLEQDVGQSTIPFIDLQNITTYPATPISGAGIYHRRKNGMGGFLALKLFTYDVAHHLKADLPMEYKAIEN